MNSRETAFLSLVLVCVTLSAHFVRAEEQLQAPNVPARLAEMAGGIAVAGTLGASYTQLTNAWDYADLVELSQDHEKRFTHTEGLKFREKELMLRGRARALGGLGLMIGVVDAAAIAVTESKRVQHTAPAVTLAPSSPAAGEGQASQAR